MNYKKIFLLLYIYTSFSSFRLVAGHIFSKPIISKTSDVALEPMLQNYKNISSSAPDNLGAMDSSISAQYYAEPPEPTHQDYLNLLKKRKNNNKNLNAPFDKLKPPLLHDLIEKKYNDLVKFILTKQPNININQGIGLFKRTYLHTAVLHNNPEVIKMLFDKQANPDPINSEGTTPLKHAILKSNLKCLKLLVASGANVDGQKNDTHTPLQNCIICLRNPMNPISCTRHLLRNYANPNILGKNGTSPLIIAVEGLHRNKEKNHKIKTLAKLLIIFGADINIRTIKFSSWDQRTYTTAPELAREKKQNDLADYIELCAQQRDELIEQVKKNQPINYAKIFLSLSYLKDIKGNNLVYHALQNNNFDVLSKLLYLRPAMITEPNFTGQAPIDRIDTILRNNNDKKRIKLIQFLYTSCNT